MIQSNYGFSRLQYLQSFQPTNSTTSSGCTGSSSSQQAISPEQLQQLLACSDYDLAAILKQMGLNNS